MRMEKESSCVQPVLMQSRYSISTSYLRKTCKEPLRAQVPKPILWQTENARLRLASSQLEAARLGRTFSSQALTFPAPPTRDAPPALRRGRHTSRSHHSHPGSNRQRTSFANFYTNNRRSCHRGVTRRNLNSESRPGTPKQGTGQISGLPGVLVACRQLLVFIMCPTDGMRT